LSWKPGQEENDEKSMTMRRKFWKSKNLFFIPESLIIISI
jgi:hypothetical protein